MLCAVLAVSITVPSPGMCDDCEVVSFSSYEASYASVSGSGSGPAPIIKRFCAVVKIKSQYGTRRFSSDAKITAYFKDDTWQTGALEPRDPVNDIRDYPLNIGETYTGISCFEADAPIVRMECAFD
jgi:hypothetical protein